MAYIKGKDLLLKVGGKPVGHCTSHTITYNTNTEEVKVKPVATKPVTNALFTSKEVTGLSISISFEGLRFYEETENGYEEIAPLWGSGQPVEVESFKRSKDDNPMLKGKFIIDTLEETAGADGNATYSGQLSNNGDPEIYPGKEEAA